MPTQDIPEEIRYLLARERIGDRSNIRRRSARSMVGKTAKPPLLPLPISSAPRNFGSWIESAPKRTARSNAALYALRSSAVGFASGPPSRLQKYSACAGSAKSTAAGSPAMAASNWSARYFSSEALTSSSFPKISAWTFPSFSSTSDAVASPESLASSVFSCSVNARFTSSTAALTSACATADNSYPPI